MNKFIRYLLYVTYVEVILSIGLLFYDLFFANLELGVFIVGVIDFVTIIYFSILNRVVNRLFKKRQIVNLFISIMLLFVNFLPYLFYLRLMDYL